MKKKKDEILTVEEQERRATSRLRCFWGAVALVIFLVVYFVYQIIKLFI